MVYGSNRYSEDIELFRRMAFAAGGATQRQRKVEARAEAARVANEERKAAKATAA
jgi:hypothetical protein